MAITTEVRHPGELLLSEITKRVMKQKELGGDLSTRFVDFETVKTEMEDRADSFARDTLLDPVLYKALIKSGKYHDLNDIKSFSAFAEVPHWVVIGRLQSDEWIDWSYFVHEIPKFEWIDD